MHSTMLERTDERIQYEHDDESDEQRSEDDPPFDEDESSEQNQGQCADRRPGVDADSTNQSVEFLTESGSSRPVAQGVVPVRRAICSRRSLRI